MTNCTNPAKLLRSLLLLAVFAGLAVPATQAGDDPFAGRWWTRPRIVERLGLSEAQVRRIEEISYAHQDRAIELRAELDRANLALGRMLEAETIDNEALAAAIDRVVAARCALVRSEIESRAAVAQALDLPQRRMLRQLRRAMERPRDRRDLPRRRPRGMR